MKLNDLLLERSAVIKKDGFAVLQTALNNELPDNMNTNGIDACLLHSFSEAIRQQTGERLDRMSLLIDLNDNHEMEKDWGGGTVRKHHDLNELIKHITTTGVKLKGSNGRVKFNIKLHVPKSLNDVKKFIHEGISLILCWQNTYWMSDAMDLIQQKKFMELFDPSDLDNLSSFKKKYQTNSNVSGYVDRNYDFSNENLWDVARGIIPYKKNHRTFSSYHGVLLVGYDEKEKVFILKDIRAQYLLKGMCKLPQKYVEDMLKGGSDLVKIVIGIEAEKLKY